MKSTTPNFLAYCNQDIIKDKEYLKLDRLKLEGQNLVNSSDLGQIRFRFQGKSIQNASSELAAIFNQSESQFESQLKEPCQKLKDFRIFLNPIFSKPILAHLTSSWPPVFPSFDNQTKLYIAFLLDFIRTIDHPVNIIRWLVTCAAPQIYEPIVYNQTHVIAFAFGKRKRKVHEEPLDFWAVLDSDRNFVLFRIENDQLIEHFHAHIKCVITSASKKTIKFCNDNNEVIKRFVPKEEGTAEMWINLPEVCPDDHTIVDQTPLPFFFGPTGDLIPDVILFTLYDLITQNDMLFVRSILDFRVAPIAESYSLCEALFDIFAFNGQVPKFLMLLATDEFSNPTLTPETVLRGNSAMTNIFKVLYERYGINYCRAVQKPILDYIVGKGDVGLSNLQNANIPVIRTMLYTVLQSLLKTAHLIPPEIRMVASILKMAAISRFNKLQSAFYAISSFIFLRFFSAYLVNPTKIDPQSDFPSEVLSKIIIPFSQILQSPFNLKPFSQKYEPLQEFNEDLQKNFYGKFLQFVLSIGDPPEEEVRFTPPSEERFKDCLRIVMKSVGKRPQTFREVYQDYYDKENQQKLSQPGALAAAAFFESFFQPSF